MLWSKKVRVFQLGQYLCVEPQCPPLVQLGNCCWITQSRQTLYHYLHAPPHLPFWVCVCTWERERRYYFKVEHNACVYESVMLRGGQRCTTWSVGLLVWTSVFGAVLSGPMWPLSVLLAMKVFGDDAHMARYRITDETHKYAASIADKVRYSWHIDTTLPWTRICTCWNHTKSQ